MSAGDGLARLGRARPQFVTVAAAAIVVLCAFLPGRQPLWRVFAPGHYRTSQTVETGRQVLAMVPPDAAVVAQAAIVPHLSQRTTIYMLEPLAPDGDYVIAQADLSPWPNATRAEILRLVLERERRGPGQPARLRLNVARVERNLRTELAEGREVKVDRPVPDRAASGERYADRSGARQQRAEHQNGGAHGLDQVVRRVGRECGRVTVAASDPASIVAPMWANSLLHRADVRDSRQVGQANRVRRQDRRRQAGQRGVLGA